jgi:prolyl-tRNA synthetase
LEIAKVKIGDVCERCGKGKLKQARASEVGNVFDLGQKYPKDFALSFADGDNQKHYPWMGCYGIGISRVVGVIVEKWNDERGIIWPLSVAPLQIHLVSLSSKKGDAQDRIMRVAQETHDELVKAGVEVLWDDRTDASAGEKFADADLIGLPLRLVISEKTLKEDAVEWKLRAKEEAQLVKLGDVQEEVAALLQEK